MVRIFFSHRFDFLEPEQVNLVAEKFRELFCDLQVELVSMSTKLLEEGKRRSGKAEIVAIVEEDLAELKKADLVLMDVSIEGWNYIGVTCEMVYAYQWKKPIIAFVGDTKNGERMWLRYHASKVCSSLEETKNAIREYAR